MEPTPATLRDVARKLVPNVLLQQRGIIRRLGPKAGRIYAALRVRDALGIRTANRKRVPPDSRSFVFVCFGNIMRSAMAEFLMRKELADLAVDDVPPVSIASAGVHATPGREAHPWAQEAAKDLGISLANHRAKLLSREMVEQADCILAMDFQNKAELLTIYPESHDKMFMLSAYAEGPWQNREIPDPYLGNLETTRFCGRQLQTCIRKLLASTLGASRSQKEQSLIAK